MRDKQILYGSYPELVTRDYRYTTEWFASYVSTYIERDVKNLFNIGNLRDFQKLIRLLAARCAQELNLSHLAKELGVTIKTVQNWSSILEASYIIFLLPSYHNNLGKRIIKRPKVYFYDTGLICYLTGISTNDLLEKGPLSGPIFENYVVAEMKKAVHHFDTHEKLYYFRSGSGLEIDVIVENPGKKKIRYIEIKNNSTAKYKMVGNLKKIMELNSNNPFFDSQEGYLIYRGKEIGNFSNYISYINYKDFIEKMVQPG